RAVRDREVLRVTAERRDDGDAIDAARGRVIDKIDAAAKRITEGSVEAVIAIVAADDLDLGAGGDQMPCEPVEARFAIIIGDIVNSLFGLTDDEAVCRYLRILEAVSGVRVSFHVGEIDIGGV